MERKKFFGIGCLVVTVVASFCFLNEKFSFSDIVQTKSLSEQRAERKAQLNANLVQFIADYEEPETEPETEPVDESVNISVQKYLAQRADTYDYCDYIKLSYGSAYQYIEGNIGTAEMEKRKRDQAYYDNNLDNMMYVRINVSFHSVTSEKISVEIQCSNGDTQVIPIKKTSGSEDGLCGCDDPTVIHYDCWQNVLFDNLEPGQEYEFKARFIYSDGTKSNWCRTFTKETQEIVDVIETDTSYIIKRKSNNLNPRSYELQTCEYSSETGRYERISLETIKENNGEKWISNDNMFIEILKPTDSNKKIIVKSANIIRIAECSEPIYSRELSDGEEYYKLDCGHTIPIKAD